MNHIHNVTTNRSCPKSSHCRMADWIETYTDKRRVPGNICPFLDTHPSVHMLEHYCLRHTKMFLCGYNKRKKNYWTNTNKKFFFRLWFLKTLSYIPYIMKILRFDRAFKSLEFFSISPFDTWKWKLDKNNNKTAIKVSVHIFL